MKTKVVEGIFDGRNVIVETDEKGNPLFEIESTSMAIGYVTKSCGKEYVHKTRMNQTLKNAEITPFVQGVQKFITLNQLYDFLIEAQTKKSKSFKKWVTSEVLPTIEKTGAYIEPERENEMVKYYFSNLSSELQSQIVTELMDKNKELQQFYDDLLNTDGLYSMNTIGKELNIGLKTLFAYLRGKDVMFYKDNINIPYQRFMKQGLFSVVESPCPDGKYRPVTFATKKGLEYIRKLLRKDGYYDKLSIT